MNILKLREWQAQIVEAIQQAIELAPEVCGEVQFQAYKNMQETSDYWNADYFEVYDTETEDISQTAADMFWHRLNDCELAGLEEMDAIELFNLFQYGVFGELVYG